MKYSENLAKVFKVKQMRHLAFAFLLFIFCGVSYGQDIGPTLITNPSTFGPICPNPNQTISVIVRNYDDVAPFDFSVHNVRLTINVTGASTQTILHDVTTGVIPAGQNAQINFTSTVDLSNVGTHTFTYRTDILTNGPDIDPSNDQRVDNVVVHIPQMTLTSAVGSNTQTLCQGAPITDITYAVSGSATGAELSDGSFPDGVTGSFSGGTFTISGTPTETGTFPYEITTTGGGCQPHITLTGEIIVDESPGLETNNIGLCAPASSANLTNPNFSSIENGSINYYTDPGFTTLVPDPTNVGVGTYYVRAVLGTCVETSTITVSVSNPSNAGTISGNQTICQGSTTVFSSNGDPGGVWSSDDTGIATVNSTTGEVMGVSAGSTTIRYTVPGSPACGNAVATRTINVVGQPNAGEDGSLIVCEGTVPSTAQLFAALGGDPDLGGSWSNIGNTYTYTVNPTAPCTDPATANVFVSEQGLPNAGTDGTLTICEGDTPSDAQLFAALGGNPDVGGTWSNVGNVYTYTVAPTAPCTNSATANVNVTIQAQPNAGEDGTLTICEGSTPSTADLFNALNGSPQGGGNWTQNGIIYTYTVDAISPCTGSDQATVEVIEIASPDAGTNGSLTVCQGDVVTESQLFNALGGNPHAGGVWSNVGNVYTYTVSCAGDEATAQVTVNETIPPSAGTVSGTQNLCVGDVVNFTSSGNAGGTWSSSNTNVATVNSTTGEVVAVSFGQAVITYTVLGTGGCPNAQATAEVTVTSPPNAGVVNGIQEICEGNMTLFTSTGQPGGVWSSSNTTSVTVDPASGEVTAVGEGVSVITYTVAGTGGCSDDEATLSITVTATPNAGVLAGNQELCIGENATFTSNGDAGGTWSSSDVTVATVNASGEVTAVGEGVAEIIYTIPAGGGCLATDATRSVTVTAPVDAGNITGITTLCEGTSVMLASSGDAGGTWSSSDATIASVDPVTGEVTALEGGTVTITYTVQGTGGCPDDSTNETVTVVALPNAGTDGSITVCGAVTPTNAELFTALGGTPDVGGTWSNVGNVYTYTVPATAPCVGDATAEVTVITLTEPDAGQDGTLEICAGDSFNESDLFNALNGTPQAGGVWSNIGNEHTYTVTCDAITETAVVTVAETTPPSAGSLSGQNEMCVSDAIQFSTDGDANGTWSSDDTSVASVNAVTGMVTANQAGTTTLTYTVIGIGGCSDDLSTITVTVTESPSAGTVSGNQEICEGNTTQLNSNGDVGGIWSSDNTGIATVDVSTGLVTGVSGGTAVIRYTVEGTGGCEDDWSELTVTVTATPTAGTISGTQAVCLGETTTYTSTGDQGGTWTSSDLTVATVDAVSGELTAVSEGTVTLMYTVEGTGGCTDDVTSQLITVVSPPSVTVNSEVVCEGETVTLTATSTPVGNYDYAWTVPSGVTNPGNVSSINAGVAGDYTVVVSTNDVAICSSLPATGSISVQALPNAGTNGALTICADTPPTDQELFNALGGNPDVGGTWSSVGNVYTYTVQATAPCTEDATADVVVTELNAPDAGEDGELFLCEGLTPTTGQLFNALGGTPLTGGTWSNIGNVYTYSVTCNAITETSTVTLIEVASPNAGVLSGEEELCVGSGATIITNGDTGGTWSSSNTSVITVNAVSGQINAVAEGQAEITYTVLGTNGCSDASSSLLITATDAPNAGQLAGPQQACEGTTLTITTNGDAGGVWSSSDNSVLTIDAITGEANAITAGTVDVLYTVAGVGGCADAVASRSVTVFATPNAGGIVGDQEVCEGTSTILTTTGDLGGGWSSSDVSVATVNLSTGEVTAVSAGQVTVSYTLVGQGGCSDAIATFELTVVPSANAGEITGEEEVCVGATTTLASTGDQGGTWSSSEEAVAVIDPVTGELTAVANGTTTISYTVDGTAPCTTSESTFVVTVSSPADAGEDGTITVCEGETPSEEELFEALGGNPALGGTWSQEENVFTYTIAGTAPCNQDESAQVVVEELPNPSLGEGGVQNVCIGRSVTLSADEDNENYTYSWEFMGNEISTASSYQIINAELVDQGNYSLTVTNENGCSTEVTFVVVVDACGVKVPKGFSPNNDGINDLFVIENLEAYPGTTLEIFNRWGTKVYESENYLNDWDGRSMSNLNVGGDELPEGTYFYTLKLGGEESLENHGELIQGYVYIKR